LSVAAAVRITSADEAGVITRAADFARQLGVVCYVISIVSRLPYGASTPEELDVASSNIELISRLHASPVMQEGTDVPANLLDLCSAFDVRTLFLRSGSSRLFGRTVPEQLLYLQPQFDVVVVKSDSTENGPSLH
jgi:K+-sensing histidine kinase KdpD